MVAPITSTVRLPLSPLHVLLPADFSTGLTVASVAVFNQSRAVDGKRLIKKLGAVDALVLAQVDEAIKAAFGLTLSVSDLESQPPDDRGGFGPSSEGGTASTPLRSQ